MTTQQHDRIRSSFQTIAARGDELARQFFLRLLAREPMFRTLLPKDTWQREQDLLAGLGVVVKNIQRPEAIEHLLMEVGSKASRAGVMPQHYGVARESLMDAMRGLMGKDWNDDLESDWTQIFNALTSIMLLGAGRARARAA